MRLTCDMPEHLPAEIMIELPNIIECDFCSKDRYMRVMTASYIIESYDATMTEDGFDLGNEVAIVKREEGETR